MVNIKHMNETLEEKLQYLFGTHLLKIELHTH